MLNKKLIAGVMGAALAVTAICPLTSFAAKTKELTVVDYAIIEGTDEQHELGYIEGVTTILEVDGL